MNQYGIKLTHHGKPLRRRLLEERLELIDRLRRAEGSQASHRARREAFKRSQKDGDLPPAG